MRTGSKESPMRRRKKVRVNVHTRRKYNSHWEIQTCRRQKNSYGFSKPLIGAVAN